MENGDKTSHLALRETEEGFRDIERTQVAAAGSCSGAGRAYNIPWNADIISGLDRIHSSVF